MTKAILLFGGGLDSVAYAVLMHHELRLDFTCLHVDYGQRAAAGEVEALRKLTTSQRGISGKVHAGSSSEGAAGLIKHLNDPQKIGPKMLFTGNGGHDPYVEGRNLSLILHTAALTDQIFLGLTDPGYTPFTDADSNFLRIANEVVRACFPSRSLNVLAPWISLDRTVLVSRALQYEPSLFDIAFTCWTPKIIFEGMIEECGECKHCASKAQMKSRLGVR